MDTRISDRTEVEKVFFPWSSSTLKFEVPPEFGRGWSIFKRA
jgi:hypothetical protein